MTPWYVLEWNALDYGIELYEWETSKSDEAEVWDEVSESLHQCSAVLIMSEKRLSNLFKAVRHLQKQMEGGKPTQ